MPTSDRRLSRQERRERTRAKLLEAAATVFAAHGYHGTSVDMVAEAAGYTKGAVYSNFESKEDLFLALLDTHLDAAVAIVAEIVEATDPAERAAAVGARRSEMAVYERDWFLLETEFVLYAARNDRARELMAARQRRTHERIAVLVRRHLDDLGADPAVDSDDLAVLLSAAGDGLAIASLTRDDLEASRLMTVLLQLVERATTGDQL